MMRFFVLDCMRSSKLLESHHTACRISSNLLNRMQSSTKNRIVRRRLKNKKKQIFDRIIFRSSCLLYLVSFFSCLFIILFMYIIMLKLCKQQIKRLSGKVRNISNGFDLF